MKLPEVKQQYFPLQGGLDLLTPAISLAPGKLFDSQGYEPEISGGYRRVDGYERFDGRPNPTSAAYWTVAIALTGNIFAGQVVTGATSGATGRVLGLFATTLVLGRVTGTFVTGESLQIAAVTVATSTSASLYISEPNPSNDADYMLLAANDYRADIQKVPGSGPIRGVWIYSDVIYAFRDNAGGTAGLMYSHSATGWVQVAFNTELAFTAGSSIIAAGTTINGATSGATATVKATLLRTGTWGGTGVGALVIVPVSGSFVSGESIRIGATVCATASAASAAITRAPGGLMEFTNANFTGSTATLKIYGVDGVNPCFEFDGTTYVPIRTGMAADTPKHLIFHKNYLMLSFLGSIQLSALGLPYSWTTVLGALEFAIGDEVTGFLPQAGNAQGSVMGIFSRVKTYMLYGSSASDFRLVTSIFDLGYLPLTLQPVSNNTYGLTARGIQSLITTLTFGDFDYASVSHEVQPFLTARRGMETASNSSRIKNQYRIYFSDGYALAVGLTGDKISGLLPLNYGRPVRCIVTANLSTGQEVTYFGSDDGYIYRDSIGTSFDGGTIESWIRPAFNHVKSPRIRKRYRRAVFELRAAGFSKVNIGYDIGYANPDTLPPVGITNTQVAAGGFWDQFTWDQFTWDSKVVTDISMSLSGTEKNISFLFYSNRAQDKSHTAQGVTILYTPQRIER